MCFGTSSGRLSQLCHFGPIIAIFLIVFITLSGLNCLLQWWPPESTASKIHLAIYLTWPILIFYNYFNAVFVGPGFVPKNWRPENKEDEEKLQFCKLCNSFKAPRAHHCKKCQRCVLKMDHHCPWINTCTGHFNHASFVYFLIYAPLGCSHALCVIGPSIYRAIFRNYYVYYDVQDVPIVSLSILELIGCMFAFGMAFGVAIAVGILLFIQIRVIIKNETGIESWIIKKAAHRREHAKVAESFVFPYNLGRVENLRQVFNWSGDLRPIGNGIWWNVASGCDQFSLTREQLAQKEDKRVHAIKYMVTDDYSGSIFACRLGCRVCCCVPWLDEKRIPIKKGEVILVTRWQRHWYYGEKIVEDLRSATATAAVDQNDEKTKSEASKGWLPAKCVRPLENPRKKKDKESSVERENVDQEPDMDHKKDD